MKKQVIGDQLSVIGEEGCRMRDRKLQRAWSREQRVKDRWEMVRSG
jgi:hypothetical protein